MPDWSYDLTGLHAQVTFKMDEHIRRVLSQAVWSDHSSGTALTREQMRRALDLLTGDYGGPPADLHDHRALEEWLAS